MSRLLLRVTLRDYLLSIEVTPYQLGKWTPQVSAQTIYAICAETRRPSLDVLAAILETLRAHGFDAQLADVLKVEEEHQSGA